MPDNIRFTENDGVSVYFRIILVNLVLQAVIAVIISAAGIDLSRYGWLNMLVTIAIESAYLAVFALFVKKRAVRPDIRVKPIGPASALLAAAVSAVCLICFFLTADAFQQLLGVMGYKSQGGFQFDSPAAVVLGIFATCILAPVAEEAVLRGALLSGLLKRHGAAVAIALSSLAFSLMHMNPEQTVYQLMLGLALGVIAWAGGSLLPCIIIHAGSNLIAVLLEIVGPLNAAFSGLIGYLHSNVLLYVLLLILLFAAGVAAILLAARFFYRRRKRERTFPASPPLRHPSVTGEESGAGRDAEAAHEPPAVLKPSAKFAIAMAVCVVMWVSVFVSSVFLWKITL